MQDRRLWKPEGSPEGGHALSRCPGGATRGVAAPPGRLGQGGTPHAPFGLYLPLASKTLESNPIT